MAWLRKNREKPVDVEFCDSSASVCDGRCRSQRVRQASFDAAVRAGWRGP